MTLRFAGLLVAAVAFGQTRPQFEVASIKPSPQGEISPTNPRHYFMPGPGMLDATKMPVRFLIAQAFGVKDFQIVGGPDWVRSDWYDITAKSEPMAVKESREQGAADINLRLQALLEDRFALRVHRETREMPVYELTVGKGGLKVQAADCVTVDPAHPPAAPAAGQARVAYCGSLIGERRGPDLKETGTGIRMKDLIGLLTSALSRPVIDKTGYAEAFNATLEWSPEPGSQFAPVRPNLDDSGKQIVAPEGTKPSIFTALQAQLGLKVESAKGPVEMVVIDRVERPSAN